MINNMPSSKQTIMSHQTPSAKESLLGETGKNKASKSGLYDSNTRRTSRSGVNTNNSTGGG